MSEPSFIVLVKKRTRRKSKRLGRFSRSTRANYRQLGLKAGASRKAIERAYKLQARKNHPDCGGSEATMRSITAAYEAICAALPKRGRPPKHSQDHDGYAIVDELNNSEPVLEGFESRQAAEQALSELRERLRTQTENQSSSRDLTGRRARFVVVGRAGAERVKAHRQREKEEAAEEARSREERETPEYWNRILAQKVFDKDLGYSVSLSLSRGMYLGQADPGKGLLITGGWSQTKIESVTAAHDASLGGPDAQARRSRGGGFRCFGAIGNGPDQFEKYDPTAETAETYFETRLSTPDGDVERECWANHDDRKRWITGDEVDPLLGPSIEDQRLAKVPGWSSLPATIDDSEDAVELGADDLSRLVDTDENGEDEYNEVLDAFEDPNYIPPLATLAETPPTALPEPTPEPAARCNEIPRQFDVVPASNLLTGNDLATP